MRFRSLTAFLCAVALVFCNVSVFSDNSADEKNAAAVFSGEKKIFCGSLKEAVNFVKHNSDYSYIELSEDVVLDGGFTLEPNAERAGGIVVRGDVTVDINGGFCTQTAGNMMSENALFTVPEGSRLTFEDASGNGTVNGVQCAVRVCGGELVIDGGTFKAQSQSSAFPDMYELPIEITDGGTLTMRKGRIEYSGTLSDGRTYDYTSAAVRADKTSVISFEGGSVSGEILFEEKKNLNISGGRFSQNMSELIGEGFEARRDGGMYEIVEVLPRAAAVCGDFSFEAEVLIGEGTGAYTVSAKSASGYRGSTVIEISEVIKAAVRTEAETVTVETDAMTAVLDKKAIKRLAEYGADKVYFSAEKTAVSDSVLKIINTARTAVKYGFYAVDETNEITDAEIRAEIPYYSKTKEKNIRVCFMNGKNYTAADNAEYDGTAVSFDAPSCADAIITEGSSVAIQGKALDLKGSISLVFYARLDDIDPKSAKMLFWTSPQKEYTEATAERIAETSGKTAQGYKFEYKNIASKDMNTKIYARICAVTKDGKKIYGEEPKSGYGITDYAKNMMKDEKLKPLLVTMLNYGAAAQDYFGSDDEPVNRILADADRAVDGTKIYDNRAETIAEGSAKCASEIKGKTLTLDGDISINYYTSYRDADNLEYGMLFWTERAFKAASEHVAGTETYRSNDYEKNGEYIVFSYKNIVSSAMNDRIYARLYVRSGSSYTYGDIDSYSVGDYAASKISKGGDPKLGKLLRTLMLYGEEAEKYFGVSSAS